MRSFVKFFLFGLFVILVACEDDDLSPLDIQKQQVLTLVDDAILHYQVVNTGAFSDFSDTNNSDWVFDEYYVFVNESEDPNLIVAHINPDLIGTSVVSIVDPDSGYELGKSIVETAVNNPDGAWVPEYRYTDPATGSVRSKFSYVKIYDGFVFGSGYYVD